MITYCKWKWPELEYGKSDNTQSEGERTNMWEVNEQAKKQQGQTLWITRAHKKQLKLNQATRTGFSWLQILLPPDRLSRSGEVR